MDLHERESDQPHSIPGPFQRRAPLSDWQPIPHASVTSLSHPSVFPMNYRRCTQHRAQLGRL